MTADLSVYGGATASCWCPPWEMGYHVAEPGGAFYLFPAAWSRTDLAFSERAKQFDLLLVPGSGSGPGPLPSGLLRPDRDDPAGPCSSGRWRTLPLRLCDEEKPSRPLSRPGRFCFNSFSAFRAFGSL